LLGGEGWGRKMGRKGGGKEEGKGGGKKGGGEDMVTWPGESINPVG